MNIHKKRHVIYHLSQTHRIYFKACKIQNWFRNSIMYWHFVSQSTDVMSNHISESIDWTQKRNILEVEMDTHEYEFKSHIKNRMIFPNV